MCVCVCVCVCVYTCFDYHNVAYKIIYWSFLQIKIVISSKTQGI